MQAGLRLRMRSFIVLSTLSFILKVLCMLEEGRYFVEVKLNGYTNPTGQCEGCKLLNGWIQTCCDVKDINFATDNCIEERRCDSYFIYCLRPIGDRELDGCSSSEHRNISFPNSNDGPLNFSQSTVLGLSNPQVLSGLRSAYEGVQVYIEILDQDNITSNDLVDLLLIDHDQSVAQPLRQNHTGMYNFVTMDLTISVVCAEKFAGSDCTQCVPGFTGPGCNMQVKDCSKVTCSGNGECNMDDMNTFHCVCDAGFTGVVCQTNISDCVGVECSGNGHCVDGVCECARGFRGPQCEVDGSTSEASGSDSTIYSDTTASIAGTAGGARRGGNIGAIAGGVVGSLLAVVVLLILVAVAITIVWKHCNNNRREAKKGSGNSGPLPGDNPVYEQGNTSSELNGGVSLNTRTPLPGQEGIENSGEFERKFDNFIYGNDSDDGDDEIDGDRVYTAPFDQQDQQSPHHHEFENPIYGTETSDS